MRCPYCATAVLVGQCFCGACGATLPRHATADPLLHGERRQLTVLFCDLVGSTVLAQQLDPEDLRDVIHAFFECCGEVIERFGGHFAGRRGDGCLVLFGYPRAFEDAPARAVRTGLALLDAVAALDHAPAPQLQVRIGIATGTVVIDTSAMNGEAVGEALNLAARLQEAAPPGAVVVSESTHALSGRFFEFRPLEPLTLKGFASPVAAWRVLGLSRISDRYEALRAPALAPIVGRGGEIARLLEAWRSACRGEGRAILLAGEAGIGKSRIVREVQQRIRSSDAAILRFDCSPYHMNSALHPVIEAIERSCDLSAGQAAAQRLEALRRMLQRLGGDWRDRLPWLATLLGIAADVPGAAPQQRKEHIFAALLWWLAELARGSAILMVVEDVHWIDPTSREFLAAALGRLDELGILAVITCRPEALPGWAQDGRVTPVPVERLEAGEAEQLVRHVAGRADIDCALVEEIVARADGVPLFIEELTRTALGMSVAVGRAALPATLQDSLLARLDQLSPERRVAQIASVIGREFQLETLVEIAGLPAGSIWQSVDRLVDSGLLVPRGGAPDGRYAFKHSLVQQAAYESLWRQDRRQLHARTAAVLERTAGGRPGAAELLAQHFTEAGLPAAALKYRGLAAQSAFERSANLEVIFHLRCGLALLEALPASPERDAYELSFQLLLGAASWAAKGFASKAVEQSFGRAGELAAATGDDARLMDVLRGLFGCYYARGELQAARRQAERIRDLAERTSERADLMVAHLVAGQILFWRGEFAAARAEQEAALALYDAAEQRTRTLSLQIDPSVNARMHLGWTLWVLGYPDRGVAEAERAVADARRAGQPFGLAMALFWQGAVAHCCGDWQLVRRVTEELRRITTEHHIAYLGACATVLESAVCLTSGRTAAGIAHLRRAFDEFRTQQAGLGWPWALSLAIAGCVEAKRRKDGLAFLEEAFAATERNGERHWEAELRRLESELLADGPAAEDAAWRAIGVAREQSARSIELRCATSLARRMARRGAGREAGRLVASVLHGFTEGLGTADLMAARRLVRDLESLPIP